jgi:HAD superfamily hydrolase (TIGR01458 family)
MAIHGVLLDLGGVVYVGDDLLPGARDALDRLAGTGLPVRYLTNTTRTPQRLLRAKLEGLGLPVAEDALFMPALAARQYLEQQRLTPRLLVHPALAEDFADLPPGEAEAVVVGDAADGFTYAALNDAFRALHDGAAFLALARNRSFREADGRLSLDAGPFVAALEYAAGREALVLGKPAPAFFHAAVDSLGSAPTETVMIGDDVEADICGAEHIGIHGILVRSGKYEPGDEDRIDPRPDLVVADLAEAVDWIVSAARAA